MGEGAESGQVKLKGVAMRTVRSRLIKSILLSLSLLVCCGCNVAKAQYPDRSVRLIVPFPTGGATDILGRILAKKLGEMSGQSFVVENRAGASGMIAADARWSLSKMLASIRIL